ncbi:Diuretic hormone 44 receptor-like protein [Daphnia magna]|uniref:Diuretic hormone 44 receptor-like protein n=1 Tax=Daphnia magna TaxID=35525 RepID=A0A162R4P3_9CRUS|nr:Diuretic hormone 44 receptor-like protein [Daphnia magna]
MVKSNGPYSQRLYTKPWIPRVRVCGQRNHRVCVDAAHPSLRFAVAKFNCNQYTPQIDCWTIKHFEPNKLKNKKKKRILQLTFYQYRRASSQAGTINRHRVQLEKQILLSSSSGKTNILTRIEIDIKERWHEALPTGIFLISAVGITRAPHATSANQIQVESHEDYHRPVMTSDSDWLDQTSDMTEDAGSGADKALLDDIVGLEELMALNITNENELDCLFNFLRQPYPPEGFETVTAFCNSTWDGLSCWPTTLAGSTSVLPCVDELNGIKYDTSHNATRVCQPNGTWANYSNYRSCVPLSTDFGGATPEYGVGISEDTTTIYFTGYTVSIVALTLAIWIFIHFNSSVCYCVTAITVSDFPEQSGPAGPVVNLNGLVTSSLIENGKRSGKAKPLKK